MTKTLLLVEDNADVQNFNKALLEAKGFRVITALTLFDAAKIFQSENVDLIVLDIGMPDGSGLNYLANLREHSVVPVLILSGFSQDKSIVKGFEFGCDDYLSKPYSFDVLFARINRLLKRGNSHVIIEKGKLVLNINTSNATVDGVDLQLSLKHFSLLKLFVENENIVLAYDDIYGKIWGYFTGVDNKTLANSVYRLRKKLTNSGYTIRSDYGNGYVFEEL